jgi:hypothetical protein
MVLCFKIAKLLVVANFKSGAFFGRLHFFLADSRSILRYKSGVPDDS